MKTEPENYIAWIAKDSIHAVCRDKAVRLSLINMGAKAHLLAGEKLTFRYESEEQLGRLLATLRDLSFCFVGGSGWPPAAVFEDLREKGLVVGKFLEVVWGGENKPIISEK